MNNLMNNKKGIAPLLIFWIALSIVALIAGIALTWNIFSSPSFRLNVIGGGIIALTLIFGLPAILQGEVTRQKIGLFLGIISIGVVIVLFANVGVLQMTYLSSDDYFEKPYAGTIICDSTNGVEKIGIIQNKESALFNGKSYPGMWLSDELPKNTDIWNIKVTGPAGTYYQNRLFSYIICPTRDLTASCLDGGTKELTSQNDFVTFNSPSSRYIFVSIRSKITGAFEQGNYNVVYNAYFLKMKDIFRGGDQLVPNAIGCVVPTSDISWTKRILSSTSSEYKISSSDNVLQPGEFFNYIGGTVTARKDGNIQDNGYCIYTNGKANIYKIDTIKTATSEYNIVDTSSIIGSPECCNGIAYPNGQICSNGNFVDITSKPCNYNSDCGSLEWNRDLTTSNQIIRNYCGPNKICTSETKKVDCTINSNCASNEICSRNTWSCITASTIEDVSSNEECSSWYQEPGIKSEYKYKFLGFSFGKQEVETCVIKAWIPYAMAGIIVLILGSIVIVLLIPSKSSRRQK